MTKVTVFARDNDKPGNREIVAFLKQHLQQLVQAGLRFTFTVADKMEKDLIARGIDKLPAIEVQTTAGPKIFLTPVEIKSSLLKFLGAKGKLAVGPTGSKKPEDDLHDYYAREMNMDKYEEDLEEGDGDGPNKKDIMARVQDEMERRQAENEKRGPPKPKQRGRRAGNVREQNGRFAEPAERRDEEDDTPPPRRAAAKKVATPRDRVIEAGGDPASKDDSLLISMMETSDDV